ncbi:hypothetical protein [Ottowia thiooxydans]|uniref:hypothetical protein n=1 Tax=Ottowia thiooxydans TaxID=219182 RepID=UPI00042A78A2|nr:hypothetical protein [Ottowia thiooxydans]
MITQHSLNIEIGAGRHLSRGRFSFSRNVQACGIGLSGYNARLLGSDDDELGMLSILLDVKVTPDDKSAVEVTIDVEVRDVDLSARYTALIEFVIFAELEPVGALVPGEPRPDIWVTGIEFNQAIQAFRSSQHLAIQHALPDNAIPLVEGKPTCARVYVDLDGSSTHPMSPLSGTLTIRNGNQEITVSPVAFTGVDGVAIDAPVAEITPHPDGIVSRQRADRTLNFLLPTTLCEGEPTITVNLVLVNRPGEFVREYRSQTKFVKTTPPPIHLVGVRYTGPDVGPHRIPGASTFYPLPSECRNEMAFANRLYPMAPITSSYDYMDWSEAPDPDGNSPVCDSFGGIVSALLDMLGDRRGVIVGFMPPGYPRAGGCGGDGGCVSRIDSGSDARFAHEFGHALGFDHAPCQPGECVRMPPNPDDNYPNYQPYAIGSIGEFGVEINGSNITLRTPQVSRDVLGYAPTQWVSPYTYLNAFNQWSAHYMNPSPMSMTVGEPVSGKRENLFLDIQIDRQRQVTLASTFHFPVRPRTLQKRSTAFSIEFSGEDGRVLVSSPIYDETYKDGGGCGCCGSSKWPIRYRHPVPYDVRAKKLSIYECDELIHEECIPAAPVVQVTATGHDDECSPHVVLEWSVEQPQGCAADLIYVVQVQVDGGDWAGLAPRSTKPFLIIDKTRLLDSLKLTKLRVLASSGIATGIGYWESPIAYEPCAPERHVKRIQTQRVMHGPQ